MTHIKKYEEWLNDSYINETDRSELLSISDNAAEIEDRFFKDLEFGTGGMRGVLGIGTNRLNIYTVRKATQGLADYIAEQGENHKKMGVVIAYDCRRMSPEFTDEAALVLAANGIPAYVFDSLRPTPVLSFAVRHLGCTAGIVITASHNPPEYNGYKVYWQDGGQVPFPRDEAIIHKVNEIKNFRQIKIIDKKSAADANLYRTATAEVDDAFIHCVKNQSLKPEIISNSKLKIVYTPLHGSGYVPVCRALKEAGFKNLYVVDKQAEADGNFPTVKSPNPEDKNAFKMALELAEQKNADIVVATDPDADRVGAFVKSKDGYVPFTGNMTGVLLTEYILGRLNETGKLPKNGAVISTIVSTDLTRLIAAAYGAEYFNVLTGFKYIGEKIKQFEETGSHEFLFGFEESYGSLAGSYARDKDAVVSAMLLCEAAAYYMQFGMTLTDAIDGIYKKYGYFTESIDNIAFKGSAGIEDMKRIMNGMRKNPPLDLNGFAVSEIRDYLNGTVKNLSSGETTPTGLPVSDVLYFDCGDAWFCARPSGTEPKIKIYYGICVKNKDLSESKTEAAAALEKMSKELRGLIGA
ncbi:MAG: phospho-sugar mutase [Defluviitaleaceae bacterium]|nr:phospho-sugar mutase [Defluviitaleaceae bacterium]